MRFAELYQARKDASELWRAKFLALQADCTEAAKLAWRQNFPRRKFDWAKALTEIPGWKDDTYPCFERQAEALFGLQRAEEKRLDGLMDEQAGLEPIPQTEELSLHHTVYASTYASQGYGCEKYTREAAQRYADQATRCGLRAEVREVRRHVVPGIYGGTYVDYGVFANTTEVGWAQTQHMPGQTLREWVMTCWGRGVNPRVMNPYLPHDFEEKQGIGYHGEDLRDPHKWSRPE